MEITSENILLTGSILLFISILAGKTSYKFGVPTLVFFLIVGMLAGSEGLGGIYFDDPKLAQFVGIVAFNFILFSGGIETDYKFIKPVVSQGMVLSTLGVLITAGSLGLFVWYITNLTIYESLLLGAIVSSTDSAAVFSVLRSKNIALKHNLRPTLELESGSNDPMANVLTIVLTSLVLYQNQSLLSVVPFLLKQICLGAIVGFVMGKIGEVVINKIKLDFEGLYPVLVIALVMFTFSFTDFLGGNGFLAVYLSGVMLGNKDLIHKKAIIKAFDGYSWLMQIVLFLTLGLLVFPSKIYPVMGIGLLISVFLIVIARPLSVFLSLSFFKVKLRSKLFLSWVGLRGAVPIVFATYPLVAGLEKSQFIFNVVFFISLTSVMIQGTTLSYMAKWLRVSLPNNLKPKTAADLALHENIKNELIEIILNQDSPAVNKRIVELKFPKTTLITLIEREGKFITPNGSTLLQANDKLLILSENKEGLQQVFEKV